MEREPAGRRLEIATALALGVVSLVTALGVLQASAWNTDAARYGADAADARDQSVALEVVAQLKERSDRAALNEARRLAGLQDAAIAAGDVDRFAELELAIGGEVGPVDIPDGAFEVWRENGFPPEASPITTSDYYVARYGDADALVLTSQRLGDLSTQLTARAAIFGQASLVHALALFLFGVAGINRLRVARFVTLAVGSGVFVFGLFLMSTAY